MHAKRLLPLLLSIAFPLTATVHLYWWQPDYGMSPVKNFGDEVSHVLIRKMATEQIEHAPIEEKGKLLALGSILRFARNGDTVWGSGINGNCALDTAYSLDHVTIRAVRGPLTRNQLLEWGYNCPEVYGDPALLLPLFFPEFQADPQHDYIVIPHISEVRMRCFMNEKNTVLPCLHWKKVIQKITQSKFVISSSLHGIVIAEAFGIPARLLRVSENESLFKYRDYYASTGRDNFEYATSIEEALLMGGEILPDLDLQPLLDSCPFEWEYPLTN